jgi:hypothetical protein
MGRRKPSTKGKRELPEKESSLICSESTATKRSVEFSIVAVRIVLM